MNDPYSAAVDSYEAERRELARENSQLRAALEEATQHGKGGTGDRAHIEPSCRVERSRGTGLGERIPVKDGQAPWLAPAR